MGGGSWPGSSKSGVASGGCGLPLARPMVRTWCIEWCWCRGHGVGRAGGGVGVGRGSGGRTAGGQEARSPSWVRLAACWRKASRLYCKYVSHLALAEDPVADELLVALALPVVMHPPLAWKGGRGVGRMGPGPALLLPLLLLLLLLPPPPPPLLLPLLPLPLLLLLLLQRRTFDLHAHEAAASAHHAHRCRRRHHRARR